VYDQITKTAGVVCLRTYMQFYA